MPSPAKSRGRRLETAWTRLLSRAGTNLPASTPVSTAGVSPCGANLPRLTAVNTHALLEAGPELIPMSRCGDQGR